METIEYRTQDKSEWGAGDWRDEPDKKQWQDKATGYPCLIVRNRLGALCGYVGVPKKHPFYMMEYNERKQSWRKGNFKLIFVDKRDWAPEDLVRVHGGLTFSGFCHKNGDEGTDICHVGRGSPWWFGFDCAHAWDIIPSMNAYRQVSGLAVFHGREDETYRNIEYVTRQVESLAKQLKAVAA